MRRGTVSSAESFMLGVLNYEQDHGERNEKRQDTQRKNRSDPSLYTHTHLHRHTHPLKCDSKLGADT